MKITPTTASIRIRSRLILLSAMYVVPFTALTAWLVVKSFNAQIDFAQMEQSGNAYQRPLEALLRGVGRYHLFLSGALKADEAQLRADVDKGFDELMRAQARHGKDLQFTPEGLASRKRETHAPEALKERWSKVTAKSPASETAGLLTSVRVLITHAGDISNLILDPELDTYYLMDVTLLALPQYQERLVRIAAEVVPALKAGPLTETQRKRLAVDAALILESDLERLAADVPSILNEAPANRGTTSTIKTDFEPALAAFRKQAETCRALLVAVAEGKDSVSADELAASVVAAHEASFTFWTYAVNELDALLALRIDVNARQRTHGLVTLALFISGGIVATGLLTRSLNRQLSGFTHTITSDTHQVEHVSREVSRASVTLAENASAQAASLQEVSAALEQVSGMARQNATSAGRAKEVAAQMRQSAEGGSSDADALLEAMNALQTSSANIGQIIKTIDEIAFQTNILALNAAVEAARAGAAGAGFAVVADEVRNLAQRSAVAAKETSSRIEDSIEKAAQGAQLSGKVAMSLSEIATRAREVDGFVAEIAEGSHQQATGVGEIVNGISSIDTATQANAASAEETAAAAQELNSLATSLNTTVSTFHRVVIGTAEKPEGDAPLPPRQLVVDAKPKPLPLPKTSDHSVQPAGATKQG